MPRLGATLPWAQGAQGGAPARASVSKEAEVTPASCNLVFTCRRKTSFCQTCSDWAFLEPDSNLWLSQLTSGHATGQSAPYPASRSSTWPVGCAVPGLFSLCPFPGIFFLSLRKNSSLRNNDLRALRVQTSPLSPRSTVEVPRACGWWLLRPRG